MQVVKDLSREWQVADAKAKHAEHVIEQARQAQLEGRGTAPSAQQLALANQLRELASGLLVQLQGRAKTLRGHQEHGRR